MIVPVVIGLCIISVILLEAFETIILPRRVSRRFRLTRAFYVALWAPTKAIARLIRSTKARETFLSFFGPLSLLILFGLWAASLIFGFGFLYYGNTPHDPTRPSLETCIYLSGTTFFTLGLGDVTPHTPPERVLAIFESGLGFGFLAMIISYLPVIYQAFSKREVTIVLLDARAGSPPTAAELLLRHAGPHGLDALLILFRDWEHWSAELLESHISYPVVSFFRSQHTNESWLAALAAILDSTALLIATSDNPCSRQARLTFAMCRHTVADLAQVFFAKPRTDGPDRLPPEQYARMYASLEQAGYQLRNDEASKCKLKELRDMYEPYLHALALYLFVELPPWILAAHITDDWKTSAWGRISGFTGRGHTAQDIEEHFEPSAGIFVRIFPALRDSNHSGQQNYFSLEELPVTERLENLERLIRGELPAPPIAQLIGFRLVAVKHGEAVFDFESNEKHANPMGTLHGGVLCDVADAAMGVSFASTLEDGESFTTLELKINFLRPVWSEKLRAVGKVVKRGNTVGLTECDITNSSGVLVARASSTCMVLRGAQASGR